MTLIEITIVENDVPIIIEKDKTNVITKKEKLIIAIYQFLAETDENNILMFLNNFTANDEKINIHSRLDSIEFNLIISKLELYKKELSVFLVK